MIKGSFFEYNVARSALFTAQANLQVTGHNIANAATDGYSRQYGVTVTNNPMRGNGAGMYGTGSRVTTVERIRSQFLDAKYWSQNSVLSNYTTKKAYMEQLERTFVTQTADGLKSSILDKMQELESVFSDLATNANDLTFRNNVLSSAESLTTVLTQIGNDLTQQQQTINQEIVLTVNKINTLGDQIARLSKQIQTAEFRGDSANDLRDSRELLIDELSTYVNVSVTEKQMNPEYDPNDPYSSAANYETTIMLDGQLFVKGDEVKHLELFNRDDYKPDAIKKNPSDGPGLYDIKFQGGGVDFKMYSSTLKGTLKGLIDMRDGNNNRGITLAETPSLEDGYGNYYSENEYGDDFYRTTNYKGIPHYLDRLNELTRVFAQAMNEGIDHNGNQMDGVVGHVNGYDLEGNTGRFFYTMYDDAGEPINNIYDDDVKIYDSTGTLVQKKFSELTTAEKSALYKNIDWNSFNVSTEIKNNPALLATSSKGGTGESDNKVSLGFSSLMDDTNLFAAGKLTDYVIGITTEAAISAKQVNKFEESYSDIVTLADNQRISVSGVDIDEEGVNMVKYQQMYQAAAKMISIMDTVYDITINQLIG